MGLLLDPALVQPVARGLLGSIEANGGPTEEQRRLLQALISHLWQQPQVHLETLEPLAPEELAALLPDAITRSAVHQLQMTLELCRHPQTPEQLSLGEAYADALGIASAVRQSTRDWLCEGVDAAVADVGRTFNHFLPLRSEPFLAGQLPSPQAPEPQLVAKIQSLDQLPEGSLGQSLLHYYQLFGFPMPGQEASPLNHLDVAHDMTHVIAGIAVTDVGEIALSAFQLAMHDNPVNQSALLASLMTHEVGITSLNPSIEPIKASLDSPGACQLLAEELERGSHCRADFSLVDHWALAPRPLAEVRQQFGVRPPLNPNDGHHVLWD